MEKHPLDLNSQPLINEENQYNDEMASNNIEEDNTKKNLKGSILISLIVIFSILFLVGIFVVFFFAFPKNHLLSDRADQIGKVTPGTEYYDDFLIDNVIEFKDKTASLHFHIYIPSSYNETHLFPLYITLPGAESYYSKGVANNLKLEKFANEAKKYIKNMIIVAPQPNNCGKESVKQIEQLTEYMIAAYFIDLNRIYISGYSEGGKTLSNVVSRSPELFTAALHMSSEWNGKIKNVAKEKVPLYLVTGKEDEVFGSNELIENHENLVSIYKSNGVDENTIKKLAILDIKEKTYFIERKASDEHSGGLLFAKDENIMGWLFTQVSEKDKNKRKFSIKSNVKEVVTDPYFGRFGRLLFPVDKKITEEMTLKYISSSSIYEWYNYIVPSKTVEILQLLHNSAKSGNKIFYSIYSDDEQKKEKSKVDTGIFYFRGKKGEKFVVANAGGGSVYVAAMQDSFPHCLELAKKGYNCFALIYRPDDSNRDLAKAISFIYDHSEELGINRENYSLWGGSHGARMAAALGNKDSLASYGRSDIPQASAVIMQYTAFTPASEKDAPTYGNVGKKDKIVDWKIMESRIENISSFGINTEFHAYDGLPHGFGLGFGTIAEGWIDDAIDFWENQCNI